MKKTLLLAFLVTSLAMPLSAQQPTVRVRATIESVDGQMLAVKARDGAALKIKMTDNVNIVGLEKAALADITNGSFVGATAMPEQDGTWKAVEVHIFPEAMRGTGEGDRPYDYHPKSTMTNGTVNEAVAQVNGSRVTLDGEKKIDVTPETAIVRYVPSSKAELKPGAKIYIAAAKKLDDGTLETPRVNVGLNGLTPPM